MRQESISKLVVALPVAPPEAARELEQTVDQFICLETPPDFISVGSHYVDFSQVSDREVMDMVQQAMAEMRS
jgi:predicted phosphoribosyltransferase